MVLPLAKIQQGMEKLSNWALEGDSIVKEISFQTFPDAIEFVNAVSQVAEEEKHHPNMLIEWKIVRLTLTTHDERGLSEKDFIMAEKIDAILKERGII